MDAIEAIYGRRSVKHYDPDHEMPETDLRKLLEAAMQSPTSFNIQHWRFVVVKDKSLRGEIRAAGFDQAQMTDASILLVMTADTMAWKRDPGRYWKHAPVEVAKMLVDWMAVLVGHAPRSQTRCTARLTGCRRCQGSILRLRPRPGSWPVAACLARHPQPQSHLLQIFDSL